MICEHVLRTGAGVRKTSCRWTNEGWLSITTRDERRKVTETWRLGELGDELWVTLELAAEGPMPAIRVARTYVRVRDDGGEAGFGGTRVTEPSGHGCQIARERRGENEEAVRRRRLGRRHSPSCAAAPRVGAGSLALLAMLCAPACDSPTRPLAAPLELAGELLAGGTVSHPLELLENGTLEVGLLELVPILVEVSSGQDIALGFALGRPSGDACVTSSNVAPFSLGDQLLYALAEGIYCISIYDAGYLPADAHVRYKVTVRNRYES